MKIRHKETEYSIRYKNKFLFLPKTINYETRWLEKTSWAEQYNPLFNKWFGISWGKTNIGSLPEEELKKVLRKNRTYLPKSYRFTWNPLFILSGKGAPGFSSHDVVVPKLLDPEEIDAT